MASTSGTSVATPIVAGFVAVAMQRWSQATGNQIVQSLVATATTGHQPLLNPNGLDTADPTQYPDTNPLLDKFPGTEPTAQTVADYADGLLAIQTVFDNDPPTHTAAQTPPPSTPTPTAPPWTPHPDTTKRTVPTENSWSAQWPGAMATTPPPSALSTNPGALRGS